MKNFDTYNPQKINHRHLAIARYMLAGWRLSEIAEITGYTVVYIQKLQRTKKFKQLFEQLQKQLTQKIIDVEAEKASTHLIKRRLQGLALKAVETLEDCMSPMETGSVRVSAAKEILDRSGFHKKSEVEADINITAPEGLAKALQALQSNETEQGKDKTGKGEVS